MPHRRARDQLQCASSRPAVAGRHADRADDRQLRRRPSRPPGDAGPADRGRGGPRLAPAVLTFDPHPREFFARDAAPPRLSTLRAKLELLRAHGVATRTSRASTRASRRCRAAIHRRGARARLACAGCWWARTSASARAAPATSRCCAGRTRTSASRRCAPSSRRRARVVDGGARGARGRRSRARGGAAGPPVRDHADASRTATSSAASSAFRPRTSRCRRRPPLSGIFAVRVHGSARAPRDGVASVGVRPTVDGGRKPLLEVFIFDFDESIYGRRDRASNSCTSCATRSATPDLDALTRQIAPTSRRRATTSPRAAECRWTDR